VVCGAASRPRPVPVAALSNRGSAAAAQTDRDDDGVADDRDHCPDRPEDFDGFEDDDGCPDPDNDGDGVADGQDDCPYEPGAHRGCPTPCRSTTIVNDDCILDPTVFYDAHDVPQQERIDEIVRLMKANPSVQALEVLGERAELVSQRLRAALVGLPGLDVVEDHRDIGIESAIYVRISKQRFDEGRFRAMECTPFGPIYRPIRAVNCTR